MSRNLRRLLVALAVVVVVSVAGLLFVRLARACSGWPPGWCNPVTCDDPETCYNEELCSGDLGCESGQGGGNCGGTGCTGHCFAGDPGNNCSCWEYQCGGKLTCKSARCAGNCPTNGYTPGCDVCANDTGGAVCSLDTCVAGSSSVLCETACGGATGGAASACAACSNYTGASKIDCGQSCTGVSGTDLCCSHGAGATPGGGAGGCGTTCKNGTKPCGGTLFGCDNSGGAACCSNGGCSCCGDCKDATAPNACSCWPLCPTYTACYSTPAGYCLTAFAQCGTSNCPFFDTQPGCTAAGRTCCGDRCSYGGNPLSGCNPII